MYSMSVVSGVNMLGLFFLPLLLHIPSLREWVDPDCITTICVYSQETHEEMIALDNDAFLKSLEDLGRVSSRPNSKNNWNQEEPIDSQRQSTKV